MEEGGERRGEGEQRGERVDRERGDGFFFCVCFLAVGGLSDPHN